MGAELRRSSERAGDDGLACNDNGAPVRFGSRTVRIRPAKRPSALGIWQVVSQAGTGATRIDYLAAGVFRIGPA